MYEFAHRTVTRAGGGDLEDPIVEGADVLTCVVTDIQCPDALYLRAGEVAERTGTVGVGDAVVVELVNVVGGAACAIVQADCDARRRDEIDGEVTDVGVCDVDLDVHVGDAVVVVDGDGARRGVVVGDRRGQACGGVGVSPDVEHNRTRGCSRPAGGVGEGDRAVVDAGAKGVGGCAVAYGDNLAVTCSIENNVKRARSAVERDPRLVGGDLNSDGRRARAGNGIGLGGGEGTADWAAGGEAVGRSGAKVGGADLHGVQARQDAAVGGVCELDGFVVDAGAERINGRSEGDGDVCGAAEGRQ